MKDFINRIYDSNNFGQFKIINEIPQDANSKDRYFYVEFLNTGYKTIASYTAIRHGSVKDYYVPTVSGIGFIGSDMNTSNDPYVRMLYRAWNDILHRCYDITDKDYKYYGEKGIKVSEDWLCFSKFFIDVQHIPRFYKKFLFPSEYQLDKDYLQFTTPKNNRIYSKETCMWVSKYDNIMIMNRDNPSSSGYFGVLEKDGKYYTKYNNKIYGVYTIPEAAACMFNYVYLHLPRHPFNDIIILNDPYMSIETILKYDVGSTTILEVG